jgi:hypothetical protein
VFSAIHFRFVVEAVLHAICFYQGLGRGFNPSTTLRDNSPLCRLSFQSCCPFVKIGAMVWLRRHTEFGINGLGTRESRHKLEKERTQ